MFFKVENVTLNKLCFCFMFESQINNCFGDGARRMWKACRKYYGKNILTYLGHVWTHTCLRVYSNFVHRQDIGEQAKGWVSGASSGLLDIAGRTESQVGHVANILENKLSAEQLEHLRVCVTEQVGLRVFVVISPTYWRASKELSGWSTFGFAS